MSFDTQYSRCAKHIDFISEPGEQYKTEYVGHYTTDGVLELEKTGEYDFQERIQADKYACDINAIVARFRAGDESVLSRVQGSYGDFTGLPKTYAEVLNLSLKAKADFDRLPVEYKQKFNNSFEEFMSGLGSDDWLVKMDMLKQNDEIVKDGVDKVES